MRGWNEQRLAQAQAQAKSKSKSKERTKEGKETLTRTKTEHNAELLAVETIVAAGIRKVSVHNDGGDE
jgi:hypothetical protein